MIEADGVYIDASSAARFFVAVKRCIVDGYCIIFVIIRLVLVILYWLWFVDFSVAIVFIAVAFVLQ